MANARSSFTEEIVPLAELDDPRLQTLWRLWESKRKDGRLPSRRDLPPEEMGFILGWVNLVEVERDPLRFRYRLVGTEVARAYGQDLTGRYASELKPPEFRLILEGQFAQVVATGQPLAHRIFLMHEYRTYPYYRLTLPLAEDGRDVSMLMTASSIRPDLRDAWERVHRERSPD